MHVETSVLVVVLMVNGLWWARHSLEKGDCGLQANKSLDLLLYGCLRLVAIIVERRSRGVKEVVSFPLTRTRVRDV